MSNIPQYTIIGNLYEGDRTSLYQAVRDTDRCPVLLKVPHPRHSRRRDHEGLKNEYKLGITLNSSTAVRPIALEMHEGMPVLVLEDFGGQPFDRLLGAPMGAERFLHFAVRIAKAVADVHQQGVVHKDVKPKNILVHPETGEVKLTDFGIASRLPREPVALESPRQVEGSLPYMSPEQTGRMNRAIDNRSDLYSLGVTFYEMLTGRLPFQALDPLEWIHCHVARVPPSPSEVISEVPEVIARIVMKLLAKMADDRYQSAQGLLHDLARCLESPSAGGGIEPFALGEGDIADQLRIPQKLYGREAEFILLLRAEERVVRTGAPELLLVSGYSGIGKSSLVHELHKSIVRERGYFIAGQFDQYKRDIPYATIAQAFRGLIQQILAEDEAHLAVWKEQLEDALCGNGQLIIDVIPQVELIIGPQPAAPKLAPSEARNRFHRVFRNFVGVFTRPDHILALFLDDLQWLDTGSLKLVEYLITHPDTRYLLFIGAFRDNEVSPSHPLMLTLDKMKKAGAKVQNIVLGPLSQGHLNQLIADTLRCDVPRAEPLARLVFEKTQGNPFFFIQFLTTLHQGGLLEFDREQTAWTWDIASIQAKGFTDNVAELMVGKLKRFAGETQQVLKLAGCLGNTFDLQTVALISERSHEEAEADLAPAVQEGLILPRNDTYRFLHHRVEEAAYALIKEEQRAAIHLRIGRILVAHIPKEQIEERIFDVVTQLNLGAALITDLEERTRVAELNLVAGRRAAAALAFRAAADYLAVGAALLDDDSWERQYLLTYSLFLERAECEFLSGAFQEAERLFPVLLQHAQTCIDKAAVYRVKIDTNTTEGKDDQAIESALECLRMFGIDISPHPSAAEVEKAHQEVWTSLGTRRIEELIELPLMADPEMQAAMEILARLYAPTYHSDNNLLYLHLCHAVNISLRHGNSAASTHAYGWFGLILGARFHRYQEGYRFARLALDLVERHQFLAYKAKALFVMRILAYWTQPIDRMLEYSRAAFAAAVETGDVPVACFSCNHTVVTMLIRGAPLSEIHSEAERGLDFVERAGFGDVHDMLVGVERFVQAMRGRTRHLSTYDDDRFSEAEFEAGLSKGRMPTLLCYYHVMKLMARFLSGDYEAALAAGEKTKTVLWAALFSAHGQFFYFYYALALAALFGTFSPEEQKEAEGVLAAHQEQLREAAETYSPTFFNAYALVSAEIARLHGQGEEAMRRYEEAIQSARENGFIQNEGLAYELASNFYRARGFNLFADAYLREARSCYARWGADGKVRQIDARYPRIVDRGALAPTVTFSVRSEQLDLLSVVKASQTISGEIVLDKLVRTLFEVVLEQGGAQRGCLILSRDGGLSIEAEASLEGGGVATKILESLPLESQPLVPVSIVNYVVRTKEYVILDDSPLAAKFASDPYMARAKPRSSLCLPILRQGEVVGVLYLENSLVEGAFTPERLTALSLLASQAAISLENALLLSKEKSARAAAEEAERRSAVIAKAGALLSETLDYKDTLARLGRLCAGTLADWCVIDIMEGEEVRRLADAHADLAKQPLLEELQQRYPPSWESSHPAARVLRSGQPLLLPNVSDEIIQTMCVDDHHARLIRELGCRTMMAVPLVARGQTVGVLSLVSVAPGRRYTSADLDLAQEVACRAAIAIDNARLYRETQEAIRVRDEFLSVASHELYTPMTSLTLSLQTMLQAASSGRSLTSQATSKLLELAARQGQRLTRLIGNLLDVSRIEMGRLPLEVARMELGALVRDVVERFEPDLARSRCSVSIRGDAPVSGMWDRSRIDQVVTNLLSNAMKFGAGKPIDIILREEAGVARLIVKDFGIGVDRTRQPLIFDRFERAVSSRHYGGLGLGLYISRRIVEAHGGSIRVESQPGSGSTFTVELPSARPPMSGARDQLTED